MELIKTSSFKKDPKWISHRLDISVSEVNIALERLEKVGLIGKGVDDSLELLSPNNRWDGDIFLQTAHRKLQEEFIQKSLDTLFEVNSKEKENSSLTVACSRSLLPQIKDKIKKFKTEIDQLIEDEENREDVYQLNISFFPLTNKEKTNA